jgi:hypothetical protein
MKSGTTISALVGTPDFSVDTEEARLLGYSIGVSHWGTGKVETPRRG